MFRKTSVIYPCVGFVSLWLFGTQPFVAAAQPTLKDFCDACPCHSGLVPAEKMDLCYDPAVGALADAVGGVYATASGTYLCCLSAALSASAKWKLVDGKSYCAVGTLKEIKTSAEDSFFYHDLHDVDAKLQVDKKDLYLLIKGFGAADDQEIVQDAADSDHPRLVLEHEIGYMHVAFRPHVGDTVKACGAWIFDCCHAAKTELHPLYRMVSMRKEGMVLWPSGANMPNGSVMGSRVMAWTTQIAGPYHTYPKLGQFFVDPGLSCAGNSSNPYRRYLYKWSGATYSAPGNVTQEILSDGVYGRCVSGPDNAYSPTGHVLLTFAPNEVTDKNSNVQVGFNVLVVPFESVLDPYPMIDTVKLRIADSHVVESGDDDVFGGDGDWHLDLQVSSDYQKAAASLVHGEGNVEDGEPLPIADLKNWIELPAASHLSLHFMGYEEDDEIFHLSKGPSLNANDALIPSAPGTYTVDVKSDPVDAEATITFEVQKVQKPQQSFLTSAWVDKLKKEAVEFHVGKLGDEFFGEKTYAAHLMEQGFKGPNGVRVIGSDLDRHSFQVSPFEEFSAKLAGPNANKCVLSLEDLTSQSISKKVPPQLKGVLGGDFYTLTVKTKTGHEGWLPYQFSAKTKPRNIPPDPGEPQDTSKGMWRSIVIGNALPVTVDIPVNKPAVPLGVCSMSEYVDSIRKQEVPVVKSAIAWLHTKNDKDLYRVQFTSEAIVSEAIVAKLEHEDVTSPGGDDWLTSKNVREALWLRNSLVSTRGVKGVCIDPWLRIRAENMLYPQIEVKLSKYNGSALSGPVSDLYFSPSNSGLLKWKMMATEGVVVVVGPGKQVVYQLNVEYAPKVCITLALWDKANSNIVYYNQTHAFHSLRCTTPDYRVDREFDLESLKKKWSWPCLSCPEFELDDYRSINTIPSWTFESNLIERIRAEEGVIEVSVRSKHRDLAVVDLLSHDHVQVASAVAGLGDVVRFDGLNDSETYFIEIRPITGALGTERSASLLTGQVLTSSPANTAPRFR